MPEVHRKGDLGTGHGCFPPRPNIQGSLSVFVNGIAVHRQTDAWAQHCCDDVCHTGHLSQGSTKVFANGLGVARIGDPVSCGSACATGSGNVFAG